MVEIQLGIGSTVALPKGVLDDILINLRNQGYEAIVAERVKLLREAQAKALAEKPSK